MHPKHALEICKQHFIPWNLKKKTPGLTDILEGHQKKKKNWVEAPLPSTVGMCSGISVPSSSLLLLLPLLPKKHPCKIDKKSSAANGACLRSRGKR